MLESILYGTVEIHWALLVLLCMGTTCVGVAAAAWCAMIGRYDRLEYGPRISDVEPGRGE